MFNINWPSSFYYFFAIIDIIIISIVVYKIILYVFHTRTLNILKGILIITFIFFFAHFLKLKTLLWGFEKFIEILPLAFIIIFQKDIQMILTRVGTTKLFRWNIRYQQELSDNLKKIFSAMNVLSDRKIGALIFLEQDVDLKGIKEKAITLNAEISEQLLLSIFIPTTPLHDGAIIIKDNRVLVARAFFPITERKTAAYLGSRHRAAIGISEQSDGIVFIVSEETGYVSLVFQGKIFYNVGLDKLKEKVWEILGYNNETAE